MVSTDVVRSARRDAKISFRTIAFFVVAGCFLLSSAFFWMVLEAGNSGTYMHNFCDVRWVATEDLSGGEDWYCSHRYGTVFFYVVFYTAFLAIPILTIIYALLLITRFCRFVFAVKTGEQPPE